MSLKDWVPLRRYTAADPLTSLSLMERALEAELHRLADDDGRIFVGGNEPWEAIAKAGGASVGDRRLLRKMLPELLKVGLLKGDGEYIWLTRRVRAERDTSRVRPGRERGRAGDEPVASQHDSGTSWRESVAKVGANARNHRDAIDPPSCGRAGSGEEKTREEKRVDHPQTPGGASEGKGDGEDGKGAGAGAPDTQRSRRGAPEVQGDPMLHEAPIVRQIVGLLETAGPEAAAIANVRFARQLAGYCNADSYTGPHSAEALIARIQRGVAGVAAAANTGTPMQSPGGYVLNKVLDPTGATALKFTAAEGALKFSRYFVAAWEKHRRATYASGPKDDEHALACWAQATDNARKAAEAVKGSWAPDEEEIIRWWVTCHFAKQTTFLAEENWSMKTFASGIGGYGLPNQPRDPAAVSAVQTPSPANGGVLAPRTLVAGIGGGGDGTARTRSAS